MITSSNDMFNTMTTVLSKQMYLGQSTQIKSASIQVDYIKNNVSNMNTSQIVSDCQIKVPAFCDMIGSNCQGKIITQKVYYF